MIKAFVMTDEEYDRLNPPTLQGFYHPKFDKDFIEILDHPDWIPVGYIPAPQNRLEWFLYHLIHGIAMRYPLLKVIWFALNNTNPQEIYCNVFSRKYLIRESGR